MLDGHYLFIYLYISTTLILQIKKAAQAQGHTAGSTRSLCPRLGTTAVK